MSQILSVDQQLDSAKHFFRPSPSGLLMLDSDPTPSGTANVPQMFQPNGSTTGSVMQFNGTLPDSVTDAQRAAFADLLKQHQFYLQSGIGLVTAWMTDKYQRVPASWADPANWQDPLSNLPSEFYTPTAITQYQFSQSMKGIEVATSFINTMVGWASGAGIVSAFSDFLGTIGKQIGAGVQSKQTSMDTYNISLGYQPVQDSAGNWQLVSTAEYYFISFNESNSKVYSSCGSAESYNFDFKYQKGQLLLNWATLGADASRKARNNWDNVINKTTVDDVSKAKNFFGTPVASK